MERNNPFYSDRWLGMTVAMTFFAVAIVSLATGLAPDRWATQTLGEALTGGVGLFAAFMCCLGACPVAFFMPRARQAFWWLGVWAGLAAMVYLARPS